SYARPHFRRQRNGMARRMSERRPRRQPQKHVQISLASITRIIAIVILIGLVAFLAIHKI
ncbi:MAG: hypothetical protein ACLUQN_03450, partial [Megasphaera sp.]